MRSEPIPVGSRLVDSLPFSQSGTMAQASAMRAAGVDGLVGYLGVINTARVGLVLAAGMGFLPVTLAGEYEDGPQDEVGQLDAIGYPRDGRASVVLDLEGLKAFKSDPFKLIGKINEWAGGIRQSGRVPKLYVGVPQPLTSDELWKLEVSGYWRGQGSVRDRFNQLAEPTGCGWMMTQCFPSVNVGNPPTWVDHNIVGQDYKGRVPSWIVDR